MWNGYHNMMNFTQGGMFMWIFWIIIIIILIYLLARNSQSKHAGREEKPLDILKKRYAKGEITKEEFEKIKKDIE